AGINMRMHVSADIEVGDSIRVALKGGVLSYFRNMLQLDSIDGSSNVVIQESDTYMQPELVTIPQILEGNHQAQLVEISNVQFLSSELGSTWADAANQQSMNRTLQDCENNQIIVRSSGYADFADDLIPEGNGSLIAIVSQYDDTWQLVIRDPRELDMDNERCIINTGESGTGTFEDPYNVAYAINNQADENAWVEGYIVGVMETSSDPFQETFAPPFQTNSNLLLAESPDETALNALLYVQLPAGEVRNALNLVDNGDRLGTYVKIRGRLANYFGSNPGLRDASEYWPEDENGTDPDVVTSIDEDFQSYEDHGTINQNGWSTIAQDGSRIWICRTFQDNHYAQATAYNSNDDTNIMWLITPPIDLDAMTDPVFEFESAQAFYTHPGFSLFISTDYDGNNIETAQWQTLEATLADGSSPDNEWVHSGFIDLSAFEGIAYIAWRYEGSNSNGQTGNFRVDNVKLYEGQ
ncbi:MAG: DUF5689 domain-containing protein, partial [Bacteroidota bacterium]